MNGVGRIKVGREIPLLHCTVLHCTYCTVLYCAVLCCTVLYCNALYCTHCTVPFLPDSRFTAASSSSAQRALPGYYIPGDDTIIGLLRCMP